MATVTDWCKWWLFPAKLLTHKSTCANATCIGTELDMYCKSGIPWLEIIMSYRCVQSQAWEHMSTPEFLQWNRDSFLGVHRQYESMSSCCFPLVSGEESRNRVKTYVLACIAMLVAERCVLNALQVSPLTRPRSALPFLTLRQMNIVHSCPTMCAITQGDIFQLT